MDSDDKPGSVLFCCDHNAVRSPMAEGLAKARFGQDIYIQSAGVRNDLELDGFAIAVCAELGIELSRHKSRSFAEIQDGGEDLSGFDLVIALSPTSFAQAKEIGRFSHLNVEYWDIDDPTAAPGTRDHKLDAYRATRDQIQGRLEQRFA